MQDPILSEATPHVAPLAAMTKPYSTTMLKAVVYFRSAAAHVNAIRPDGKKLSFINHFFKTNIQEDIDYLRKHFLEAGVPGIEECTDPNSIAAADHALDPKGAMEREVRAKVLAELAAAGVQVSVASDGKIKVQGTVDIPAEIAKADEEAAAKAFNEQQTKLDLNSPVGQQIAAAAGGVAIAGTDAVASAQARLAALRAAKSPDANGAVLQPQLTQGAAQLNMVSTADVAGASAGSNSGDLSGSAA